jgi:hypothetical protein
MRAARSQRGRRGARVADLSVQARETAPPRAGRDLSTLTLTDDHGLGEWLHTMGIFDDARNLSNEWHGE